MLPRKPKQGGKNNYYACLVFQVIKLPKLLSEQFKFFVMSKHDNYCLFNINKTKTVALNKCTQLFMVYRLIKQLEAKSALGLGTVELTSKLRNINKMNSS